MEGTPLNCPFLSMPGVVEGRAYHSGDVVLLRSSVPLDEATFERFKAMAKDLEEQTDVTFVILEPTVEVVEPRGEEHDGREVATADG